MAPMCLLGDRSFHLWNLCNLWIASFSVGLVDGSDLRCYDGGGEEVAGMAKAVASLEKEVAELRERVEQIEQEMQQQKALATPAEAQLTWQDRVWWRPGENREKLREIGLASLRKMGLSDEPPDYTAEDLQEQMIREGVRPEDRIANTILEEMRGYREPR